MLQAVSTLVLLNNIKIIRLENKFFLRVPSQFIYSLYKYIQ
jgi:hypothetical protein